jgi:hypothetical protein
MELVNKVKILPVDCSGELKAVLINVDFSQ